MEITAHSLEHPSFSLVSNSRDLFQGNLPYLLELSKEAGEWLLDTHACLLLLIRLKHVRLQPQQCNPAMAHTVRQTPHAHPTYIAQTYRFGGIQTSS